MDEPERTPEPEAITVHTPDADTALANAARLLHTAEMETDRQLMQRYTDIADAWVSVAGLQFARDEDR